jgi:hypothetical protein
VVNLADLNGDVIYLVDSKTLERSLPIGNINNPLISEQINDHYTFSFDTVLNDITKNIKKDTIIEVDDDYFSVSRIRKTRSTTVSMGVDCEHVSYWLLDKKAYPMPFTEMKDSPGHILSALLKNTPFSAGTVELDGTYYIKPTSDNIRGALIELANLVGGELVFSKFTIGLVSKRGANKGLEFKLGENLIGVTEEISSDGHTLEVDVLDLAQIEGYGYLKTVGLGDTVRTYDPELEIDETLRIVMREYNPFQRINPRVQIGSVVRDITDYIKENTSRQNSSGGDSSGGGSGGDNGNGIVRYGYVDENWQGPGSPFLPRVQYEGESKLTETGLPCLVPAIYALDAGSYVMVIDGVIIGAVKNVEDKS